MRFGHSKTSVTPVTHTQKQWCILSSFNNYKMRKFEEFTQNKSFRRLRCDGHQPHSDGRFKSAAAAETNAIRSSKFITYETRKRTEKQTFSWTISIISAVRFHCTYFFAVVLSPVDVAAGRPRGLLLRRATRSRACFYEQKNALFRTHIYIYAYFFRLIVRSRTDRNAFVVLRLRRTITTEGRFCHVTVEQANVVQCVCVCFVRKTRAYINHHDNIVRTNDR